MEDSNWAIRPVKIDKLLGTQMKTEGNRDIDLGRVVSVPIFAFLMILHTSFVWRDLRDLLPISTPKAVGCVNHVLLVCFYALIVALYLLRDSAISTNRSIVTKFIAVFTVYIPLILPFIGRSGSINSKDIIIANLTILCGMVLSLYSLWALGRSFSIVPQARKLVQTGPYRWIRHPLYLGELMSAFGVVLIHITIPKMIVFGVLVAHQFYRAVQEEKLLSSVFAEYEDYRSRTTRLIPGILFVNNVLHTIVVRLSKRREVNIGFE